MNQRKAEASYARRGRSAHAVVVVVGLQPADIVEPDEERHRAVVGGKLQGRRTRRAWLTWRPRWVTGTRRRTAPAGGRRSGSRDSRAHDTACRAGSPPARSACPTPTAGTSSCPASPLVRTHESTRKLARHLERGTGRIRSATVTHRGGRWFCSFSVEVERHDPAPARPGSGVGVDLAVKSPAGVFAPG